MRKTYDGRCSEFRCPLHGWTWRLDGELKQIPAKWDFPHAAERDLSLPEAHVLRTIRCNWKIANETFTEVYPVGATHPQGMTYTGDLQSQIDFWGNTARELSPKGIPNLLLN